MTDNFRLRNSTLPLVDWLITFVLLATLTVVARWRKALRALDRRAYRHFSAGLVTVTAAMLLRLYAGAGLLDPIPFLAEPLFSQLLIWVVVITGMTLITSGLAGWLPIARRRHVAGRERMHRLEIFHHLEQLASIEPRVEPFMKAVLRHLVRGGEFSGGVVFSCSADRNRVKVLDQVSLPDTITSLRLHTEMTDGAVRLDRCLTMVDLPPALREPAFVLPITVADHTRAAFLLYREDNRPVTGEAALDLRLTADIIARRIADSTRQMKLEHYEHRNRIFRHLSRQMSRSRDVAEMVQTFVREISPLVRIDLVRLMMLDRATGTIDRITIGQHDTQLVERSISTPEELGAVLAMCNREQAEVFVLDGATALRVRAAMPGTSDSVAVMAFPQQGEIRSLIYLGGPRPQTFAATELQALEYFLPLIAAALAADRASRPDGVEAVDFLQRRAAIRYKNARPGIKSSLSGILGSVELLRTTRSRSVETTNRYLDIIDRSARKISDMITGDAVISGGPTSRRPHHTERETHETR